ncbi:cytochrome P450 [Podospora didyma]|uniref:Cytochrome P450 n=1 Tax=Podospora didyma TaxID=330526 RepID=A0AAE0K1T3_9PEZI|nr:cytochrome P450 [Podospora didyma]
MAILGLVYAAGVAALAMLCFVLGRALHNILLHPLRTFPGPRLWSASRLPYAWNLCRGRLHLRIRELHDEFGPVVRIAPDELSFTADAAWHDIYCGGFGNKGFPKHAAYRNVQTFVSLFDADDAEHSRLRQLLGKEFFSLEAARRQERIIQEYASRLITQLRAHAHRPVDMRTWINWLTFDVAAQFTLSEDFGCLDRRTYHPWIAMVLTHFKLSAFLMIARFYPPMSTVMFWLAPRGLLRLRDTFIRLVSEKIDRRIGRELPPSHEGDFVAAAFGKRGKEVLAAGQRPLTRGELEANCILLLLAGSETMTTSLLGATHLLCENPAAMRRLGAEVRAHAADEASITLANTTTNMPYLNAVLRETHRLCPPVANGPARVVNRPGTIIAGYPVPVGTAVGVTQFATNRSAQNFAHPDAFHPERWLTAQQASTIASTLNDPSILSEVPQFQTDIRSVARPFVTGGRDCIGQNLSWVEFRIVLARLVWNFPSMRVCRHKEFPAFGEWTDLKAFELWEKEAYNVWLAGGE